MGDDVIYCGDESFSLNQPYDISSKLRTFDHESKPPSSEIYHYASVLFLKQLQSGSSLLSNYNKIHDLILNASLLPNLSQHVHTRLISVTCEKYQLQWRCVDGAFGFPIHYELAIVYTKTSHSFYLTKCEKEKKYRDDHQLVGGSLTRENY